MWETVFIVSMWTYWFSEGCTEGYTFAKSDRRMENKLICAHKGKGNGVLDYHAWRLGENIGTVGAVASAYMISSEPASFAMVLAGSWLTGTWIYERSLNYVFSNELFPKKDPYYLMGLVIPRNQIVEGLLTAGLGIALLIGGTL
jgi:hypothetical protein